MAYQMAIAKQFRNGKRHMWNFVFQLLNVKILDKKGIFAVKNKQKGKYVRN